MLAAICICHWSCLEWHLIFSSDAFAELVLFWILSKIKFAYRFAKNLMIFNDEILLIHYKKFLSVAPLRKSRFWWLVFYYWIAFLDLSYLTVRVEATSPGCAELGFVLLFLVTLPIISGTINWPLPPDWAAGYNRWMDLRAVALCIISGSAITSNFILAFLHLGLPFPTARKMWSFRRISELFVLFPTLNFVWERKI